MKNALPAWMSLGRSGELLVMSEFLFRGYNVSRSEIDTGHDLVAISEPKKFAETLSERTQITWPIQVKTSRCNRTPKIGGFRVSYETKLHRLCTETIPDVTYFFLARTNDGWERPLIIPRKLLAQWFEEGKLGNAKCDGTMLSIQFVFRDGKVFFNDLDVTNYLDNWSEWPKLLREDEERKSAPRKNRKRGRPKKEPTPEPTPDSTNPPVP